MLEGPTPANRESNEWNQVVRRRGLLEIPAKDGTEVLSQEKLVEESFTPRHLVLLEDLLKAIEWPAF